MRSMLGTISFSIPTHLPLRSRRANLSSRCRIIRLIASSRGLYRSSLGARETNRPEDRCCVLLNLVGNAINFTDIGEVSIIGSSANGSFNVAVRDTAPGISAVYQTKLFQEQTKNEQNS